MQELEFTWDRVLRIWWAFTWRGMLIGMVIGIALAAILLASNAVMGPGLADAPWYRIISWLLILPIIPVVLRIALRKKYSDFRIVLVPVEQAPTVSVPVSGAE